MEDRGLAEYHTGHVWGQKPTVRLPDASPLGHLSLELVTDVMPDRAFCVYHGMTSNAAIFTSVAADCTESR